MEDDFYEVDVLFVPPDTHTLLHKTKRKKEACSKLRLKQYGLIALTYLILGSYTLFAFSKVNRIHLIGNQMYTSQTLMDALQLSEHPTYLLLSPTMLEQRLQRLPHIADVQVEKQFGQNIVITIQEEEMIGYTIEEEGWLIDRQGEKHKMDERVLDSVAYLPYFHNFDDVTLRRMAKELKAVSLEQLMTITEIMPHPASYDEHQVQMVSAEGLKMYASLNSLFLIEEYTSILPTLINREHCLYFDGMNHAIVAQQCEATVAS